MPVKPSQGSPCQRAQLRWREQAQVTRTPFNHGLSPAGALRHAMWHDATPSLFRSSPEGAYVRPDHVRLVCVPAHGKNQGQTEFHYPGIKGGHSAKRERSSRQFSAAKKERDDRGMHVPEPEESSGGDVLVKGRAAPTVQAPMGRGKEDIHRNILISDYWSSTVLGENPPPVPFQKTGTNRIASTKAQKK